MVRFVYRTFLVLIVVVSVGIGGLATAKRVHTGSWSMPDRDDLAWLEHMISRPQETPRVIYLNRDAIAIAGGFDDASDNRSQLVDLGVTRELPGFQGSDRQWRAIVRCVKTKFTDFNVAVTDQRPRTENGYIMVHVGGQPSDVFGIERKGMGGVAPFNSGVIPDSVVFAFSDSLNNRVESVCNTVAHEVGHVYGLDHAYRCKDVMTYLSGCGKKVFVHADVRCGESERRDCDSGDATQNSHQRLLDVLGPRKRPPRPVAVHVR